MTNKNLKIKLLIPIAREIADAYAQDCGAAISLGQLFNKVVESGLLPETVSAYKGFSRVLSKARDAGEFPRNLLQDAAWISRKGTRVRHKQITPPEGQIKKTWYVIRAYGGHKSSTPSLETALTLINRLVTVFDYTDLHLKVDHYYVPDEEIDEKIGAGLQALQEGEQ